MQQQANLDLPSTPAAAAAEEKEAASGKKKTFDTRQVYAYLDNLNDSQTIIEDKQALHLIARLYVYSVASSKKLDIVNLSLEFDFCRIICELIETSYKQLEDYLNNIANKPETKLEPTTNEEKEDDPELVRLVEICSISVGIVRNFSNYSIRFIKKAHENNVILRLFAYLKNSTLIDYYEVRSNKSVADLVRSIIGSLVNLSRLASSYSDKWKDQSAIHKLLDIAEKLKEKDDCQLACYITLANIADDDEIDKLEDLKQVIPVIAKLIGKIASSIETKKNLKRVKINLDENINEKYEIARVIAYNVIWNFVELVDALYHMACNDTIKHEIYDTHKMSAYLRSIVTHGNEVEVEYALKMLWQLCFDERVAADVRNDEKLMTKIKELANKHHPKHEENNDKKDEKKPETPDEAMQRMKTRKNVERNCEGIIWLLHNKHKHTSGAVVSDKEASFDDVPFQGQKRIMISYNRETRDICLKIKQELERAKFSVWIDVEDIHGSSLDSMARAVENSMCVLVCITEKYKMSPYCRAEAEYTFSLGKPFVPLIMQNNYKPDGWLGILLGSKIFINFTKYDFPECIRRLLMEIRNYTESPDNDIRKPSVDKPIGTGSNPPSTDSGRSKCTEWTESDVEKWLVEKKIHSTISRNVCPCNGQVLHQLYTMLADAPEFFYKSISSNELIPTRDVALFALELKKLF